MARWFVTKNGVEAGPVDDASLRRMANTSVIDAGDLVRRDDMVQPIAAGKVKGLFSSAPGLPSSSRKESDQLARVRANAAVQEPVRKVADEATNLAANEPPFSCRPPALCANAEFKPAPPLAPPYPPRQPFRPAHRWAAGGGLFMALTYFFSGAAAALVLNCVLSMSDNPSPRVRVPNFDRPAQPVREQQDTRQAGASRPAAAEQVKSSPAAKQSPRDNNPEHFIERLEIAVRRVEVPTNIAGTKLPDLPEGIQYINVADGVLRAHRGYDGICEFMQRFPLMGLAIGRYAAIKGRLASDTEMQNGLIKMKQWADLFDLLADKEDLETSLSKGNADDMLGYASSMLVFANLLEGEMSTMERLRLEDQIAKANEGDRRLGEIVLSEYVTMRREGASKCRDHCKWAVAKLVAAGVQLP